MKKTNLITTLSLTVVMLAVMAAPAMAVPITVDGGISDWGLSLTGDWGTDSTWVPTVGGISFFVEDNQDPLNIGANHDPLYTGVHIYGNKDFQWIYNEPLLGGLYNEPYGGEGYDIEAMYVTEDSTHIFVLIIFSTGVYLDDVPSYIGDLALDFGAGGGYGYEHGVNFHVLNTGGYDGQKYGIYATPTDDCWTIPTPFTGNRPAEIDFSIVNTANTLGFAQVNYASLGISDHGRNNWVVEIGIPKAAVGNPDLPDDPAQAIMDFWISETCGNDSGPSIPEFLTIVIPAGMLVGLFYVVRRKRQRERR